MQYAEESIFNVFLNCVISLNSDFPFSSERNALIYYLFLSSPPLPDFLFQVKEVVADHVA